MTAPESYEAQPVDISGPIHWDSKFDDSIAYYPADGEWRLLCSIDGCNNKAAATCHGDCMRAVCAEHVAGRACCGGAVCVECND